VIYRGGYVFNHYRVEDQLKKIIRGGIIVGVIIIVIIAHACMYLICMRFSYMTILLVNK
jgi:hypothetical protein